MNISDLIRSIGLYAVKTLLDEGVDVNLLGDYGRTPLHIAVEYNNLSIVKLLLDHGANVNARDRLGNSPLDGAADKEIIRALIEKGADIKAVDRFGRTRLDCAVYRDSKIARLLLDHGANVNARDRLGNSPLHGAADKEIIKALIEKGADINAFDGLGRTRLYYAAWDGNSEIVRLLLDHEANANIADIDGITPLHKAANKEIFKALIEKGADINAVDRLGRTRLYLTAAYGHAKIARVLLDHGANANIGDTGGVTPLHSAVQHRRAEVMKVLLDNQAGINAKCNDHQTLLHTNAKFGGISICRILLEYGADVNVTDIRGRSPLMVAAESYQREIAEELLEKGSYVNTTSSWWRSLASNKSGESIYKDMRLHMTKLIVADLYVNDKDLIMYLRSSLSKFEYYDEQCELEKMKSKMSGYAISLYHILTTKNPRYVLNKTLVRDLESLTYNELPIYGSLIESKIKNDKRCFPILETCRRSLRILVERAGGVMLPVLPSEILERIVNKLENRDLENLALCVGLKQTR